MPSKTADANLKPSTVLQLKSYVNVCVQSLFLEEKYYSIPLQYVASEKCIKNFELW